MWTKIQSTYCFTSIADGSLKVMNIDLMPKLHVCNKQQMFNVFYL